MAKHAGADVANVPLKKGHRHYTTNEIETALRNANGYITIAAQLVGCEPITIRRRVKASPLLTQLVEDLTDRRLDKAELALDKAIGKGEGWAVCFFLKTMGKKRGYVERVEQTGADGGDLTIKIKYEDTPRA